MHSEALGCTVELGSFDGRYNALVPEPQPQLQPQPQLVPVLVWQCCAAAVVVALPLLL